MTNLLPNLVAAALFAAPCLLFAFYDASLQQGEPAPLKATVDLEVRHQAMMGFGGTETYAGDALLTFDGRDKVYRALFADLKLDFLRIRNSFGYDGQESGFETMVKDYTAGAEKYGTAETRGGKGPVKFVFTSWSPPAKLKSNGKLSGTSDGTKDGIPNATLKKGADGKFVYGEFADWWLASVEKFKELAGRYPDYVTLQNELDYNPSYEGCRFEPNEGAVVQGEPMAGYDKALAAVYWEFQAKLGKDAPGILGPETFTIRLDSGDSQVLPYADPSDSVGRDVLTRLAGVSFHIYGNGAEQADPARYRKALMRLREIYQPEKTGKLLYQTEFLEGADLVQQASMMSDAFVYGDLSAYFVWILARGVDQPGNALVYYNRYDGSVERRGRFYAIKQFSAFIGPGWHRVEASVADEGLRISAFRKDDGKSAAVVLINLSDKETKVAVPTFDSTFGGAKIYRSSETEAGEKFRDLGALPKDGIVTLLPRSVATVAYGDAAK